MTVLTQRSHFPVSPTTPLHLQSLVTFVFVGDPDSIGLPPLTSFMERWTPVRLISFLHSKTLDPRVSSSGRMDHEFGNSIWSCYHQTGPFSSYRPQPRRLPCRIDHDSYSCFELPLGIERRLLPTNDCPRSLSPRKTEEGRKINRW